MVVTVKFDVWASAFSFWGQSEVSWRHPSNPTGVRRLGQGDEESSSSVNSPHLHSDQAVFGVELPSFSQAVHGAERPFAKHRKSRHFHPDSTVKSTGRPAKLPGPGPLLGSIPLGLCRPTSFRSSSPFFPSGMVSASPSSQAPSPRVSATWMDTKCSPTPVIPYPERLLP